MTVASHRRALVVDPVSPALGVEVSNLDLSEAARNDDLIGELKQLLFRHKVLFFRDQDLSPADHVTFAERFGELETHPLAPGHPDQPKLVVLQRQRARSADNIWHSDLSWRQDPSFGSVLRQDFGPAVGGDTMWVNMAMAYDRLPDRVKERIGTLRAKHSLEHAFGGTMTASARAELAASCPTVEHPVVWPHPQTDEPVLYVNQAFTTHFVNFIWMFAPALTFTNQGRTMTTPGSGIIDLDPGWEYDDAFPFTPARQIGNMIYVAGQVALDPDGNLVGEGDIEAQTRQVFENIKTILALAGAGFEDIVKLNGYVTDRSHYRSTIKVRKELFATHPAATVVIVAGLGSPLWLVEIDVVAVAPSQSPSTE